jgi:hypothetical protein
VREVSFEAVLPSWEQVRSTRDKRTNSPGPRKRRERAIVHYIRMFA